MNCKSIPLRCLSALLVLFTVAAKAQCITTYPYTEDFESTNGGWTPGGTASDWSWGTPIKPVINSAGGGSKSWITGTLTQSFYSNNQNSTLTSPCFDLRGLTVPYIRFHIFWETERKYDGASFQYSIDNGSSWTTLGSNADAVSCPSSNWFNTSGITALGGSDGWSGNIQPTAPCTGGAGNGSGGWRIAQHSLENLAGRSNVRFRFRFASGSVCNGYDGFAIDNIWIGEAPPADGSFIYNCTGSNTVGFTAASTSCNPSFSWDFGDPASGAANVSTGINPSHHYADPGQYTVTLQVKPQGLPPVVITKQVTILGVNAIVTGNITCPGAKTGSIEAQVLPAGSYTYAWSTSPAASAPQLSGLGAGTYSVTIQGTGACSASESITLTEPSPITHNLVLQQPQCGNANGAASLTVSGGNAPYTYRWSTGSSNPSENSLAPGSYMIAIADANSCPDTARFTLTDQSSLSVSLGNDTAFCPGGQAVLRPGSYASYRWQDGSTAPTFTVTSSGRYGVTVTSTAGCSATDSVDITVDCSDVYFPTAFTPNGDGRNDGFGPAGNLAAISQYSLRVYNRWGEIVFQSGNPFAKWQGAAQGTHTYVWMASYRLAGRQGMVQRKGTVTLIR